MAEKNQTDKPPTVSPQAGAIGKPSTQQIESGAADPRDKMESDRMHQSTKKMGTRPRPTGGEVLEDTRDRLRTLKQDTDAYVRRNPAKAVFTALGIGFVLGLMRRR